MIDVAVYLLAPWASTGCRANTENGLNSFAAAASASSPSSSSSPPSPPLPSLHIPPSKDEYDALLRYDQDIPLEVLQRNRVRRALVASHPYGNRPDFPEDAPRSGDANSNYPVQQFRGDLSVATWNAQALSHQDHPLGERPLVGGRALIKVLFSSKV